MRIPEDPHNAGKEHSPDLGDELHGDKLLSDARKGRTTLLRTKPAALAKWVKGRWDRMSDAEARRMAELKVNYLRYRGESFVTVNPLDRNRVYIPRDAPTRAAPVINKIRRTVQRYTAQITADEPVMEAVPASHSDDDRDAAEAATMVIRAEWMRMKLRRELQRVMEFACIVRSGFWFFQWDETAGGETPATKFFPDERGEMQLEPVDEMGMPVEHAADAAKVRLGNTVVSSLNPVNVRWNGGRYAHEAKELMVSEVMTLRQLYEVSPKAREAKVSEIMPTDDLMPFSGMDWLRSVKTGEVRSRRYGENEYAQQTGDDLMDTASILDELVAVHHYFLPPNRDYRHGFQAMVVGKYVCSRGPLKYGILPIAQFKCMDDVDDTHGFGLVDLLREPQTLLDFVNSQILRYLQMLRRRWFVPMQSGVSGRDLSSPTTSVIPFNAQAGHPIPEEQGNIPNSITEWVSRYDEQYDDQSGIHDTLQGKHVAGVGSGRHAEALRSGDETLLGLSREQMVEGLEQAAKVIVAICKTEWTEERRVTLIGEGRHYMEKAFRAVDFKETSDVRLKNSTLLMLTPAQRLDTITTYAQLIQMQPDEIRELAPLGDVAGIKLSEDAHYQRARRQNSRFLEGPPPELEEARERYENETADLQLRQQRLGELGQMVRPESTIRNVELGVASEKLAEDSQRTESQWQQMLDQYAWSHRSWEDAMHISRIHARVHAEALASEKARRLPEWWVDVFEAHATIEWMLGYPEQQQGMQAGTQPPGSSPDVAKKTGNLNAYERNKLTGEDTAGEDAQPAVVYGEAP